MSFNSSEYRYGFQGQEQDTETGLVNYKYRMHDPRIGRFFAVDPLTSSYPFYTPYSFSGNRVTDAVELEGAESVKTGTTDVTTKTKPKIDKAAAQLVKDALKPTNTLGTKADVKVKVKQSKKTSSGTRSLVGFFVLKKLINEMYTSWESQQPEVKLSNDIDKIDKAIVQSKLKPAEIQIITEDYQTLPIWYVKEAISRAERGEGSPQDQAIKDFYFSENKHYLLNGARQSSLKKSAIIGQEAHRQIQADLVKVYGPRIEIEAAIKLSDGTTVRKYGLIDGQIPVIIKP